ncbi:hypothetical protein BMS3Bbin01_01163 [bacterium BMS3Bbin01]|nr:hypothetical protein BMS3Bbin01_01163 [bacterium BMS3Bbin01]
MIATTHPRGVGLDKRSDRAQIQRPPPATPLALVIAGAAFPAAPTPALHSFAGPHRHHDALVDLVELDVLDHSLHQPQQPSP